MLHIYKNRMMADIESDLVRGLINCASVDMALSYVNNTVVDLCDAPAPYIEFREDRRIPIELFNKVLGTVAQYPKQETSYLIYRDPAHDKWDIRAPEQRGASVHVNYFEEKHPDKNFQVAGSIHTHPGIPAMWSGTDTHDHSRKSDMLHMVLSLDTATGKVVGYKATFYKHDGITMQGFDLPLDTIVDSTPDFSAQHDPDPDWMHTIQRQSYQVPTAVTITAPTPTTYNKTSKIIPAFTVRNPCYTAKSNIEMRKVLDELVECDEEEVCNLINALKDLASSFENHKIPIDVIEYIGDTLDAELEYSLPVTGLLDDADDDFGIIPDCVETPYNRAIQALHKLYAQDKDTVIELIDSFMDVEHVYDTIDATRLYDSVSIFQIENCDMQTAWAALQDITAHIAILAQYSEYPISRFVSRLIDIAQQDKLTADTLNSYISHIKANSQYMYMLQPQQHTGDIEGLNTIHTKEKTHDA